MTLGILGGGQLGRMTALAAIPMGIDVRFLVPEPADSVAPFAGVTVADWTDADVLRGWAADCDAVTVESEWAPADRLAEAVPGLPVHPSPETLRRVRDKAVQREAFAAAGLPQPAYRIVRTRSEFDAAVEDLGMPCVAKRLEGSYDGYGNAFVHTVEDVDAAWSVLASDTGLLVEAFVSFETEVAQIVCRGDREAVAYPLLRTEQRDHRCHAVTLPSGLPADVEARAAAVATASADVLGVRGLLAVEMFVLAGGRVLINEVAPRPHNSGHLTIEACATSQFENHVRAVLGLPLGPTTPVAPAGVMVNVLGATSASVAPDAPGLGLTGTPDQHDGTHVHLYGKGESRPRRKMGHVTALAATPEAARTAAEAAAARVRL